MTSRPLSLASLRLGGAARAGDDRVRLLEAIGRTGSITSAAQELDLSYRAAWDAVQMLNNLFPKPLVRARPGGRSGGTAGLTPEGEAALATLRHIQAEIALTVERLGQSLAADDLDPRTLDPWRLVMRTSARNALRGVVSRVTSSAVGCEVALKINEGLELIAAISRRSADSLGLAPGVEALALIKASLVTLIKPPAPAGSANLNVLAGVIINRETDAAVSEVVIELVEGKTLVATLTGEADQALGLALGGQVLALIEAAHVILAVD
jgi:molybdate transport system regulatory protein